ncbi:MAG: Ferredoxin-dependent glutamate synthase [Thermoleophilia bacterium]|nr:Ferredoxin-dependent glutamate synthase [Thermoleophilia bacterium]
MLDHPWLLLLAALLLLLVLVTIHDITQKRHTIIRNFPVIGHFRYWLEKVGPELRQYIVTANDEERPFTRDERRWIYASSKNENRYFGFGSDNDMERTPGYVIVRHAAFPAPAPRIDPVTELPAAKVLGAFHGRTHAFRPNSIVNVSGMSYGALGSRAHEALNRGCAIAGCLQNTGEGGLSDHHLHVGDLTFQIGTGYFGCRDLTTGAFSLAALQETIARGPVRAIEIKLSQGAKPGHGGILPGAKVTAEIARIRGVQEGVDCVSPPGHAAFGDIDTMLEFIEEVAAATGLPVGIKSAVGEQRFWSELAEKMRATGTGPDFITVDGGEGGTGAAPLVFSDHVSLPFTIGMAEVYRAFAAQGLHEDVVFVGSGRLGLPERTLVAFALGCDMVSIGREAMLAIGCIQAQKCHTGHCPTGVATMRPWLMRGLDPTVKSARLANYIATLRSDLLDLARTCGAEHPALVDLDMVSVLDEHFGVRPLRDTFGYEPGWGTPHSEDLDGLRSLLEARGSIDSSDADYVSAARPNRGRSDD